MVRISKSPVSDEILSRIYELFFEVVIRSKQKDRFLTLLDDIFTPTEKIMIAKRIGIIYLVIKKVDFRTISSILKVSSATVSTHASVLRKSNPLVIETINNMLFKEKVLGFMDDLFSEILLQPGLYIGHHALKWQHLKRKEKRKALG